MIKIRLTRYLFFLTSTTILIALFSLIGSNLTKVSAAVCTWTGADDEFWSTGTNWDCGGINAGDELVFPLSGSNTDTVNDLPDNTQLNGITVNWDVYNFTGAVIDLRGDLIYDDDDSSGDLEFDIPINVVFDYLNFLVVDESTTLFLNAAVTGAEDFYKLGSGTLEIVGANTLTGNTNIQEGIMVITSSDSLQSSPTKVFNGASLYLHQPSGSINLAIPSLALEGAGFANGNRGALASTAGDNSISSPISLDQTSVISVEADSLALSGIISGTANLIKDYPGTLTLNGSQGNTYDGETIINDGRIRLAKTSGLAIPSSSLITIGDTFGDLESAWLILDASDQFNTSASLEIYDDGIIATDNSGITNNIADLFIHNGRANLSGTTDITNSLTIEGGSLRTFFGNVTISADTVVCDAVGEQQGSITGDPFTFVGDVTISTSSLDWGNRCLIDQVIQGSDSITISGDGIQFSAANTFTGLVTITNGARLVVSNSEALGNSSVGTNVELGGVLTLSNNITIADEPITINGYGNDFNGAISSEGGTNAYAGQITIEGTDDVYFSAQGDSILNISGEITGSTSANIVFYKFGSGTGYIQLGAANTFTAAGIALSDTLVRKNASVNIFPDTLNVNLNQYSTLDLNSFSETVGSLTGETGSAVTLGNGTLTVGANNNNSTFPGAISGNGGITKVGSGTLTLTANNNYTGATNINAGKLVVNGQQPSSGVNLNSTGVLGGTGRVGVIVGGGTGGIAPGTSPGVLNVTGNVAFASTNNFNVEINGTTIGSQYDQLNVDGSINLNNANLNVTLGFTPVSGNTFTIVQSTGVLIGTFNGLPNGSTFTVGGNTLRIDYGTNSVVISVGTGGGSGGSGGSSGNGGGLAETGVSVPLLALTFLASTTAVVVFTNKYLHKRRRLKKNFR